MVASPVCRPLQQATRPTDGLGIASPFCNACGGRRPKQTKSGARIAIAASYGNAAPTKRPRSVATAVLWSNPVPTTVGGGNQRGEQLQKRGCAGRRRAIPYAPCGPSGQTVRTNKKPRRESGRGEPAQRPPSQRRHHGKFNALSSSLVRSSGDLPSGSSGTRT